MRGKFRRSSIKGIVCAEVACSVSLIWQDKFDISCHGASPPSASSAPRRKESKKTGVRGLSQKSKSRWASVAGPPNASRHLLARTSYSSLSHRYGHVVLWSLLVKQRCKFNHIFLFSVIFIIHYPQLVVFSVPRKSLICPLLGLQLLAHRHGKRVSSQCNRSQKKQKHHNGRPAERPRAISSGSPTQPHAYW
jgi:hypothetical protein